MYNIPYVGIDLIKSFEGCGLIAYKCPADVLTIGYGHAIKPGESFGILTYQEAEDLLKCDLQAAAASVHRLITRPLNDNQYSALLSFTYNVGGGTLQRSTLRKKCNRLEDDDVPPEFMKYVYAGGRKITGLIHRRRSEAELYMA